MNRCGRLKCLVSSAADSENERIRQSDFRVHSWYNPPLGLPDSGLSENVGQGVARVRRIRLPRTEFWLKLEGEGFSMVKIVIIG